MKDNDEVLVVEKKEDEIANCWLTLEELELIAHLIHNYEQNFHDRRSENHALGDKIYNAIEELEWDIFVKNESEAHDDE
jgi:hypothetical protein